MRDLEELRQSVARFAKERDWDQFHSPKNLAMALSAEAGELLEQFQWLTPEQSDSLDSERLAAVAEEIADVQIYLVRLADRLGVDILQAAADKIVQNAAKYPAERARGRAAKYDELEREGPVDP